MNAVQMVVMEAPWRQMQQAAVPLSVFSVPGQVRSEVLGDARLIAHAPCHARTRLCLVTVLTTINHHACLH